ncbi:Yip1 family protein [Aquicoccus porphyridii]|uniref:Yip1 family protein n=1 Tax=Aquicoccus porphyridii TaxID=1852029 RepID=UPI00273F0DC6|nr:Yip1 family protein [Aquicoccus porphyridii]
MTIDFQNLARSTFLAPNEAAATILAIRRSVSNQVLWMAVVLAAVLNALVVSVNMQLFPPAAEAVEAMPPVFLSPGLLAIFVTGGLVISVFVLLWAGRVLGGKAELGDMLAVMAWIELVQVGLQVSLTILAVVLPGLAQMAGFVASIWMLFILVVFIDSAHGFGSRMRAVGVMILSFFLLVMGLMFFLLLIGASAEGGI